MKVEQGSEHVDWRKVLEDLTSKVEGLSVEEKWSFVRWELLRRNKFYRGVKKPGFRYEGIYSKFLRLQTSILDKFNRDSPRLRLLQYEFSQTCGLSKPIDPLQGNWKQCGWLPTNTELLSQDIRLYGNFKGQTNEKIRQSKLKVENLAKKSYQFPRGIDVQYERDNRLRHGKNSSKEDTVRSGLSFGPYKDFVQPRMHIEEILEGIVIWDIKKSEIGRNWSYGKIASVLGIKFRENYGKTGTAHPKLRRLRDQFKVTLQRIHGSINSEYLSHWK